MKKYLLDLKVKSVEQIHQRYVLIKLTDDQPLPEMLPGQFVEIRVDGSPSTFLRRPISINFVDREHNELWLLVAAVAMARSVWLSCSQVTSLTVSCPWVMVSPCQSPVTRRFCSLVVA